jgi:CHASE3 domain sensor protein
MIGMAIIFAFEMSGIGVLLGIVGILCSLLGLLALIQRPHVSIVANKNIEKKKIEEKIAKIESTINEQLMK